VRERGEVSRSFVTSYEWKAERDEEIASSQPPIPQKPGDRRTGQANSRSQWHKIFLLAEGIMFIQLEVAVHTFQRVHGSHEYWFGMDNPFKTVEDGGEGIGEDMVIVDEFAIGTARTIGDTPAESFGGTGEDLADAMAVLEADFVGGGGVTETAGFNDGDKAPADLGFFLGGEFDRDDPGWEGTVEQSPEAFANAGGIDDNLLGRPLLRKILNIAEYEEVIFAGPGMTGENVVGGAVEGG